MRGRSQWCLGWMFCFYILGKILKSEQLIIFTHIKLDWSKVKRANVCWLKLDCQLVASVTKAVSQLSCRFCWVAPTVALSLTSHRAEPIGNQVRLLSICRQRLHVISNFYLNLFSTVALSVPAAMSMVAAKFEQYCNPWHPWICRIYVKNYFSKIFFEHNKTLWYILC